MSDQPSPEAVANAEAALRKSLALTRDRELDCAEFLEHLAEFVDGLASTELKELMRHHEIICPEFEEERQILQRAIAVD